MNLSMPWLSFHSCCERAEVLGVAKCPPHVPLPEITGPTPPVLIPVKILWEKQGWPWEERTDVINILRVGSHKQHVSMSSLISVKLKQLLFAPVP